MKDIIELSKLSDSELIKFMRKNGISLTVFEARKIAKLIGRNPTLTELYIFNIQWSEHCSYKSSRETLKMLPTKAPNVILGPGEDAGIIELGIIDGEKYGIVIGHESHNHPSQVVPYEGAATGIGGIIRDVFCMGAKVIATADPLRFGSLKGKNANKTKYIANSVINGIAGYGNPLGIPNLAGDIYFNESFDENCLVNVVCLGLVKEKEVIHSRAPEKSVGYDIIIVGKATDNSGFGGAAFASVILDEEEQESNKGAVQVPDPFLKNILIRATEQVFRESREKNIEIGFKDCGAGGIMGVTSELGSDGDVGIEIELNKIHVSMKNLPPYIILCSETQERFGLISPPEFTKRVLEIYNEEFELPNISECARASVVGKVTKNQDYLITHNGVVCCNVPIKAVTKGIKYEREKKKVEKELKEPELKEPEDYNKVMLDVLAHPNVASKEIAFRHYDTEVLGNAVIRPGEADAGVIAPVRTSSYGIALSTDCNPKYARVDSYWGAANAVAESMRNVASVGAIPSGLTDCLNYGNPEKPEAFFQFYEGVKGIADAAKNISYYKTKNPVPVVSGNVSFYNESANGKSVDSSPVIACVGIMKDYSKAVTTGLKKKSSVIFLAGERKDELGGSVYYDLNNRLGKNVPKVNFEEEKNRIYAIIEAIDKRLILSCHDISDGGLAVSIAEMCILGKKGAEIIIGFSGLRADKILFSESSGFVFEAEKENIGSIKKIFDDYKIKIIELGTAKGDSLIIKKDNKKIIDIDAKKMEDVWRNSLFKELK